MTDPQSDNPAPDAWRFNPRAFLASEWPYLLMLILALFGVAYTSFSKTPMTMYWIALAPFIGVICVVTRWRDAENREQRLRLIWTQALHWGAVLLAMHLMFLADVSRMMNADGSALAALTVLALGTFTAGVHIGAWRRRRRELPHGDNHLRGWRHHAQQRRTLADRTWISATTSSSSAAALAVALSPGSSHLRARTS